MQSSESASYRLSAWNLALSVHLGNTWVWRSSSLSMGKVSNTYSAVVELKSGWWSLIKSLVLAFRFHFEFRPRKDMKGAFPGRIRIQVTPLFPLCFLYYFSYVPSLNVTSKTAFPRSMKGERLKGSTKGNINEQVDFVLELLRAGARMDTLLHCSMRPCTKPILG